ncbi:MAG TPA: xanthine dehydrogenase family protein molybdopterin-binding subunit, partial [Armatimonadota bacterium]|nr:xanthine dehydrogenase family protein molybdopterin-binding subunit [Armatimonadota bacterium]
MKTVIIENGFEKEVEIEVPDGPPVSWGDPDKLRILGKRNPRPEGPDKVTGRAKYASDIVLPGMLYGRFCPSTYASARITSIDITPAQNMPGVKAVLALKGNGGSVMYAGEPVAAVAAITPEIAEDAIRAIKVSYEPRPFVVDLKKAMQPGAPLVRPDTKSNVQGEGESRNGDVEAAFQRADAVTENTYEAQTRLHCCLETHGQTLKWDGPRLTVWASTQYVTGIRDAFAGQAGGPQNVRVITEHMGGGFGSKFGPGPEGDAAVRMAKTANAPVKFMLTRWDEQTATYRGPGVRANVKLGAAKDGTLLAAEVKTYNNGGVGNAGTPLDSGFYIIAPKSHYAQRSAILTNTGGTSALRAPGHPQAAVVWDMALDEMAAKLNMDPLEFRKKNHSDPVRVAEWDLGAKVIGWDRRQQVPGAAPGVKKRGIGMGSATWGGGGRQSADCTVTIKRDGSVESNSAVQDLGTGARLYVQSIVAEELGLDLKDVAVRIGDTMYGPGHASGGSTTTASVAPAVKMAAVNAKDQMNLAASKALGCKPEEVEWQAGGKVSAKGQAGKSLTWKQLCATLPESGVRVKGNWNADLQASGVRG